MKQVVILFVVALVHANVYLHNPRGSNDRVNEANANRNNGNRLFDSQNNAKGGYCWGPSLNYYVGSILSIEWTSTHGCGNPKVICNYVLQYMCTSSTVDDYSFIRDGTSTNTITDDLNGATQRDINNEYLYGLHEPYNYYQACKVRERNMGLFIADREVEGGLTTARYSAIFTRQNNNGNRHAYECPEERDYYPYWHPSPWKDIAILTDNTQYCNFYTNQSQNVRAKNQCVNSTGYPLPPNYQAACLAIGGTWASVPAFGIPPPACLPNTYSRSNILGSTAPIKYDWTIPNESCTSTQCNCVLRLRYNITSGDLGVNANRPDAGFIDWTKNGASSPVQQDPVLVIEGSELMFALDTTWIPYTFQDRSHVFHIVSRPAQVGNAKIWNLNAKGKRGNIIQAYPAQVYDFAPSSLTIALGDYIHFQWTGCDTNPAGNAGAGTDQTDRHNIVQIESLDDNFPASSTFLGNPNNPILFPNPQTRAFMGLLNQTNCLTLQQLITLGVDPEEDTRNCALLNGASQYFDGGLHALSKRGNYFFMSSRNNIIYAKTQKGQITVV